MSLSLDTVHYESSLSARGAAINAGKVSVFICIRVIPLVTLSCPRSRANIISRVYQYCSKITHVILKCDTSLILIIIVGHVVVFVIFDGRPLHCFYLQSTKWSWTNKVRLHYNTYLNECIGISRRELCKGIYNQKKMQFSW